MKTAPIAPLHSQMLMQASRQHLAAGDALPDSTVVTRRALENLVSKGWLARNALGYRTTRVGLQALGGYIPALGQAGFMDLAVAMLDRMDQVRVPVQSCHLEGSTAQCGALEALREALQRYVEVVDGGPHTEAKANEKFKTQ